MTKHPYNPLASAVNSVYVQIYIISRIKSHLTRFTQTPIQKFNAQLIKINISCMARWRRGKKIQKSP